MSKELLRVARDLARSRRSGNEAFLRRGVSTAYYAVFHALCEVAADTLAGRKTRGSEAWRRVFRGVEHGASARLLDMLRPSAASSASARLIASAFIDLRDERELADYDPAPIGKTPEEVMDLINRAADAIASLGKLGSDERLDLSTRLVLRSRR
jgi:hypothetical protein